MNTTINEKRYQFALTFTFCTGSELSNGSFSADFFLHILMGISLDGMSAMLQTWNACSVVHPLMGISLDGM